MDDEERKARQRENMKRYRDKLRAAGLPTAPPRSDEARAKNRESIARRRAEAKAAGVVLPTDDWFKRNPDKHRERIQNWRNSNLDHAREIGRETQRRRRSTPWGAINNRIWTVMHAAVRSNSPSPTTKYALALGYPWSDLRAHLEAQFTPEMNWENWGAVWEVDHIKPVSGFQYQSLADPLFREAWALSNLRPLLREVNASKGNRIAAE